MNGQDKDSTRVLHFGPGGDSTRLSEITAMNPSFLKLIGAHPEAIPESPNTTMKDGSPPNKRQPEEIARQLMQQNKRPLLNNVGQSAIDRYKEENLQLKLKIHQLNNGLNVENFNIDGIKQDLIADLLTRNDELKKQLEEYEKRDRREARTRKEIQDELEWKYIEEVERRKSLQRDAFCQTNLNSDNIDHLIRASITLKRQREQERIHGIQDHQSAPKQPLKKDQQTQHPIMSQLHYQNAFTSPMKQQTQVGIKQLAPDEKKLLEGLFTIDGNLTTVLDKLKAVLDTH